MDAGAIVIDDGEGVISFRSGRKPALGTLSLRSASAMSQAVYFERDWIWS